MGEKKKVRGKEQPPASEGVMEGPTGEPQRKRKSASDVVLERMRKALKASGKPEVAAADGSSSGSSSSDDDDDGEAQDVQ
jgi:hypothetical protein